MLTEADNVSDHPAAMDDLTIAERIRNGDVSPLRFIRIVICTPSYLKEGLPAAKRRYFRCRVKRTPILLARC